VELAESSTESQVAETVSDAARTPDEGVAEALSATRATMPCEPAAGSLSMVLQVVPLLQKVSLCAAVVSQKISTNPSLPTSTDDVAVSITGLSGPTAVGRPVLRPTPSQLTWMALDVMVPARAGAVGAGGDTNALNECTPPAALYPTRQRLDCMQAPARVPVVWSKISMADSVPDTLAEAVAVRITLSPERGDERSADSVRLPPRGAMAATDDCGTLGITGDGRSATFDLPAGEVGGVSVGSSQAAGVLRAAFTGSPGQGVKPSGTDGWPGLAGATPDTSHAAPGPDPGHRFAPGGRARVGACMALRGPEGARKPRVNARPLAGATARAMMLR